MNKLIAIALLIGLSACGPRGPRGYTGPTGPSTPEAPVTPFKSWSCVFETINATPESGLPEELFIDLSSMKYNVEGVFVEHICQTKFANGTDATNGYMYQCNTIAVKALFTETTLAAQTDSTQPLGPTTTYVATRDSLRVTTPADPSWGDLVCE